MLCIPNKWFGNGDNSYLFEVVFELQLVSYSLKTVWKMLSILVQVLPWHLAQ